MTGPTMIYSYPSRKERRESDEEIMLARRGIVKTTNFRVEYEEGSPPATVVGGGVGGKEEEEGLGDEEVPHAM